MEEPTEEMEEAPAAAGEPTEEMEQAPAAAGKRERRPVKKIALEMTEVRAERSKVEAGAGKGVKLADIPNIVHKLSKFTGGDDECRTVHNLLYRRAAKVRPRAPGAPACAPPRGRPGLTRTAPRADPTDGRRNTS